VIHAHKIWIQTHAENQKIRSGVIDDLCHWIKKDGDGYTWFHAATRKYATPAEVSYLRLYGYVVVYHKCVDDYRISWGV
jgi:hypothetical protein